MDVTADSAFDPLRNSDSTPAARPQAADPAAVSAPPPFSDAYALAAPLPPASPSPASDADMIRILEAELIENAEAVQAAMPPDGYADIFADNAMSPKTVAAVYAAEQAMAAPPPAPPAAPEPTRLPDSRLPEDSHIVDTEI